MDGFSEALAVMEAFSEAHDCLCRIVRLADEPCGEHGWKHRVEQLGAMAGACVAGHRIRQGEMPGQPPA